MHEHSCHYSASGEEEGVIWEPSLGVSAICLAAFQSVEKLAFRVTAVFPAVIQRNELIERDWHDLKLGHTRGSGMELKSPRHRSSSKEAPLHQIYEINSHIEERCRNKAL